MSFVGRFFDDFDPLLLDDFLRFDFELVSLLLLLLLLSRDIDFKALSLSSRIASYVNLGFMNWFFFLFNSCLKALTSSLS